jgi:hypothetical protein
LTAVQIVNALSIAIHQKLTQHPINEVRAKEGKDLANLILLRGCGGLYDVRALLPPSLPHQRVATGLLMQARPSSVVGGGL